MNYSTFPSIFMLFIDFFFGFFLLSLSSSFFLLAHLATRIQHEFLFVCFVSLQLLRSSLVNNRTQAKVAEELGMQEFAITNDKTKRPVALRTKTLADLLECTFISLISAYV